MENTFDSCFLLRFPLVHTFHKLAVLMKAAELQPKTEQVRMPRGKDIGFFFLSKKVAMDINSSPL